jgi:branched-chain amino acid transport system ATP-binding protein
VDAGYGTIQVLWDVSLDVLCGEALTLIDANGAGKVDFLRGVSSLLRPSGAACSSMPKTLGMFV